LGKPDRGIPWLIGRALKESQNGDFDAALLFACLAVAATSNKDRPDLKKDGDKYRAFIDKYLTIIMAVANGGNLMAAKMSIGTQHRVAKGTGYVSPSQILYDMVRCSLIHEGRIPSNVSFVPEQRWGSCSPDGFVLPESILYGLIAAVACCPANSDVDFGPDLGFAINGEAMRLSEIKGDPKTVLTWVRSFQIKAKTKPSSGIEKI
jgi:hypothetical protein